MPSRKKINFPGHQGESLAGLIELPDHEPKAIALFAHCFTCGKDIVAASRIARHMVSRGFGVMRFDFTGLGSSDGDFANTNFTSNVEDLLQAADYLRTHYAAPEVLIGHSLGGTAVLNVAARVPESLGVVTIGSPADAQHVSQQFATSLKEIEEHGEADVKLGGRSFRIRKQFVDDIRNTSVESIHGTKKAYLIMHAPMDDVVSIKEAEKIYQAAAHPKSFVSLDDADHLLSNRTDAEYVADVIASWSSRFIRDTINSDAATPEPVVAPTSAAAATKSTVVTDHPGSLLASEVDHKFGIKLQSGKHQWLADEPAAVGGNETGPDPYELLLSSVGACTAMTIRMYAERKGWPLQDVNVSLKHERRYDKDCEGCEQTPQRLENINRFIALKGDLSDEQRKRLMEIADKCPVHRTLTGQLTMGSEEINFN